MFPTGQTVKAPPRPPREEAEVLLSQARSKLLAHEKALRDGEEDQQKRRHRLEGAKEALRAGLDAHRDMFIHPRVADVGRAFAPYRGSRDALARTEQEILALKQQISRGQGEHQKLTKAKGKLQGEIKLLERTVAQYGRLLTLPVRPRRRRARRHADQP